MIADCWIFHLGADWEFIQDIHKKGQDVEVIELER